MFEYTNKIVRTLSYPTVKIDIQTYNSLKKDLFNQSFNLKERELFKSNIVQNMNDMKYKFVTVDFNKLSDVCMFFRYPELKEHLDAMSSDKQYDYFKRFFNKISKIDGDGCEFVYFVLPLIYNFTYVAYSIPLIKAMIQSYPDNDEVLLHAFLLLWQRYESTKDTRCIELVKDDLMSTNKDLVITLIDPIQSPIYNKTERSTGINTTFFKELNSIIDDDLFKDIIMNIGGNGYVDCTYMMEDDAVKQQFKTFLMNGSNKDIKFLLKAFFINIKQHSDYNYINRFNKVFLSKIIGQIKNDDENHPSIDKVNNAIKLLNIQ